MRLAVIAWRMARPHRLNGGAPKQFSDEDKARIVEHVCNELTTKRPLCNILAEDEGMCGYTLFASWMRSDEAIREAVAHAREAALEAMIEEIVEISDERNGDVYIEWDKDGKPRAKVDGDVIQRAKLRVYARERAAALLAPRRFGQKVDVTTGGEKLPAAQVSGMDRIEALIALAVARKADSRMIEGQVIDVTPEPSLDNILD